jgi:nicotinamide riboside kinase
MVAIIGGRGTGKSLLLDALRSRFAGAAAREAISVM